MDPNQGGSVQFLPYLRQKLEGSPNVRKLRGHKVMLDGDLAALYEVETRRLNEQVRRNSERFPEAFMFQHSQAEWNAFGWQFATLKIGRGQHRKCLPYACTAPS